MMANKKQVNFSVSDELMTRLQEAADKSGWSPSEQARYQLECQFGIQRTPYLPPVPSSDQPSRRRRKEAA